MSAIQSFIADFARLLKIAWQPGQVDEYAKRIELGLYLMLTDSNKSAYYQRSLLFNESSAGESCYDDSSDFSALFYIEQVMWSRRLQIANHLKDQPGSAQRLFARLCQLNTAPDWPNARVERRLDGRFPAALQADFRRVAERLAGLIGKTTEISDVAIRRQQQFGPFHLLLPPCGAPMPEEMSLNGIFACCPDALTTDYVDDADFKRRFSITVEHLNERYGLLYALGLPPSVWLKRDISDQQLDELKQLKRLAETSELSGQTGRYAAYAQAFQDLKAAFFYRKQLKKLKTTPPAWVEHSQLDAFSALIERLDKHVRAFQELPSAETLADMPGALLHGKLLAELQSLAPKIAKQKVAGCVDFEALMKTEIAREVVYSRSITDKFGIASDRELENTQSASSCLSTAQAESAEKAPPEIDDKTNALDIDEDDEFDTEESNEYAELSENSRVDYTHVVEQNADIFTPVMAFYFRYILGDSIWGQKVDMRDMFLELCRQDPKFDKLDIDDLAAELEDEARNLIQQNQDLFRDFL